MNPLVWPLKVFFDWWNPRYKRRVAGYLAEICPASSRVLDVGCDDGFVATQMHSLVNSLDFQGVDIQALRPCQIPRVVYDGRTLPFPAGAFDVVMAVDVLHHTPDIRQMLIEMARVSRHYVLIKDHVVTGPIAHRVVGFGDWLSNVPYGIPCVFNYPTLSGWREHFACARLRELKLLDHVPLGFPANPRQNPIFLLEKESV